MANEYTIRLQKLQKLKDRGINPYPSISSRTDQISEMLDNFDHFLESKAEITIAGRIMSLRTHGGSSFADLDDGSGKMQVYFKKDKIDKFSILNSQFSKQKYDQPQTHNSPLQKHRALSYQDFLDFIDTGDFIEAQGTVFITKAGEKTLLVSSWGILSKALQSIPSSWYGLHDQEMRYRKRYLDLLLNPELKQMFHRKAIFWNSMREFLISRGFLEVYTPVLETTPGGADAKPFITHHNALDIDVYLRISMGELWQKRLMVAGFPKTFEIGRQFRNEAIDPEHLQDYTQMEFYLAYADYNQGMELTEELIKHVTQKTWGTFKFNLGGADINLEQRWGRIDYREEIKKQTGIDIKEATVPDIKSTLDKLGVEYEEYVDRGRLMDLLWKRYRKNIMGPAFLINAPIEVSPLAKRSSQDETVTERFQLILAGSEVCNGYSELNDPLDQEQRFKEQTRLREAGDEEAQMHDKEFVEALSYGMPPVCGLGISERLFAFLEGKSVRECTMFPLLRKETGSAMQGIAGELGL